jgi:hypothetical protein
LQGFLRFVQPSELALSTKVAAEHLDTAKDCQAETVLALAVVVVAARERSSTVAAAAVVVGQEESLLAN